MSDKLNNDINLLIVIANFYPEISKNMLDGAITQIKLYHINIVYDIIYVPGSFEIPAAITFAIMSDRQKYDGYVALGCLIKGLTDHYHYISNSVSISLSEIAIQHAVPLGFGIITANTLELAIERADKNKINIGGKAVQAALKMIELHRKFLS
ncbi:6,7-dimethyl-8-ribityllumazine synthase [Neoehrlichia mikurensis]|uniref:6,7-dimethyl-8-ribityllumazine synthase n=1 Tax=Neoehrlichia mikurensis TaxID=89586 RepID=A0A9Q9F399_9RICK|nr:6,7-dimethyl-8-ribityllumazine synthase [Neoehrlichia mikurensis]QXK92066.1 6,7-dimethyl-8-ribityllumazine synthase [Neoehrlichia mikurensis]QXK92523.1 6,7-dimethyl-8-ribityllumazine synthase [Neoehrlichia mikurensis]QXK93759.1 6,7-dimethyl-8-ribityllumazine synthase [Neoehrlichia mikurensis]UTO55265.1 6,7-dimethyl-8-ribityllumazine synthase [Neoehrlichia mikurensis]UTO56186.1 6,7-dimethyl-8-ribityllumazine synthase [Neoehrlichia mikurensis]